MVAVGDVRLVATDLDGTLLLPDGTIGGRTRAALATAVAAGIIVVFVTGRPPRWMAPVASMSGHRGIALCANGAVVVDLRVERVIQAYEIPADVGLEVVTRLRAWRPRGLSFAVERVQVGAPVAALPPTPPGGHLPSGPHSSTSAASPAWTYADLPGGTAHEFAHDRGYRSRLSVPGDARVAAAEQLVAAGGVVKLLARATAARGEDVDRLLAQAQGILAGLVEVTHSSHGDPLLEISAAGVSKASGLAALAADLGIPAQACVAIGDMPNDLPMLSWVGTSYAVSNAHPAVLAAVDHVVAGHESEGVADLLSLVALQVPQAPR